MSTITIDVTDKAATPGTPKEDTYYSVPVFPGLHLFHWKSNGVEAARLTSLPHETMLAELLTEFPNLKSYEIDPSTKGSFRWTRKFDWYLSALQRIGDIAIFIYMVLAIKGILLS